MERGGWARMATIFAVCRRRRSALPAGRSWPAGLLEASDRRPKRSQRGARGHGRVGEGRRGKRETGGGRGVGRGGRGFGAGGGPGDSPLGARTTPPPPVR